MNSKKVKLTAALLLVAFMFSLSTTTGIATSKNSFKEANGQADITTSQATISVNGNQNTPFFHIKLNNSSTTYEVKFMNIQEFVDSNGDGVFQSNEAVQNSANNLPSLSWNFSGFKTTNDTNGNVTNVDFNFTSSSNNPSIQLDSHINLAQGNQIKFDLIISNYVWKSTNSSAKLAVKFQIAGGKLSKSGTNSLQFGDAQFSSVSTASSPDGNINVATQLDTGSTFYLLFNHFNHSFNLDPTFSAVSGSGSSVSTKTGVSLDLMSILAGLVVVGLVVSKKRFKS